MKILSKLVQNSFRIKTELLPYRVSLQTVPIDLAWLTYLILCSVLKTKQLTEAYSEPSQTSKMVIFVKIVNDLAVKYFWEKLHFRFLIEF